MSRGAVMLFWVAVAVGVWNAVFDPYVERGVRASLQMVAEAELGLRPVPMIGDVMAGTNRHGARVATIWSLIVLAAGWATTLAWRGRGPTAPYRDDSSRSMAGSASSTTSPTI